MKKLLVVLLVLGLASPAMAADWHWYGMVNTHLASYAASDAFYGGPTMDDTITGYGNEFDGEADGGLFVNMAGQGRVGTQVKVTDQLTAHVEMGLTNAGLGSGDDLYDKEEVYLRGAYGKYKFGSVSLMAGKWFTPASFVLYSGMTGDVGDMGDAIMLSTAIPYSGRRAQIRMSVAGFDAALVEHVINTGTNCQLSGTDGDGADVSYTDADFALPKIELAYQYNHPVFSLRPILGYQSFTVEANSVDSDESETITSTLLGLGVNLRFGMAKVNLWYSMTTNPGNYGIKNASAVALHLTAADYLAGAQSSGPINLTRATIIDGDVEDAKGTQAGLVVNLKFNPMVSLELGYGYMKEEQAYSADVDAELTSNLFYLNVPITVGPGMTITPEIGVLNRGTVTFSEDLSLIDVQESELDVTDELDAGSMAWYSVRFGISF